MKVLALQKKNHLQDEIYLSPKVAVRRVICTVTGIRRLRVTMQNLSLEFFN